MLSVPWELIETDVGLQLAGDYKEMVEYFGSGEFSPFLNVLVPGIENPALELRINIAGQARVVEQLAPYNPLEPYVAFPRPGGLLPWGVWKW